MEELVLFTPSKQIQESICFNSESENPSIRNSGHYVIATPQTDLSNLFMGVYEYMANFYRKIYRWPLGKDKENVSVESLQCNIEAWKNALCHGNKGIVMEGIFLGERGACYGFRDFGDYFKREDVKTWWEKRNLDLILKEKISYDIKRVGHATSGPGIGVKWIFESTDEIEIDTNLGVLYCLQFRERFLKLQYLQLQ